MTFFKQSFVLLLLFFLYYGPTYHDRLQWVVLLYYVHTPYFDYIMRYSSWRAVLMQYYSPTDLILLVCLEHNNYLCSGDTKPLRVQISRQFLCLTSIKPYKYRIRISRYIWQFVMKCTIKLLTTQNFGFASSSLSTICHIGHIGFVIFSFGNISARQSSRKSCHIFFK